MRKTFFLISLLIICPLIFTSCAKKEQTIFLSDRHVLSYDLVKEKADAEGPVTLVLLDYHNDIQKETGSILSSNWVGKLILNGSINKVWWISGRNLHEMNRNARYAWLERNLKHTYPDDAEIIRNTIELCDFPELLQKKLPEQTVITLDFDVLTKDPGPDADAFVIEMADWIARQDCTLVTLSFSATYQNTPESAWNWLSLFLAHYDRKANWYFKSGGFDEKPEGQEDEDAWQQWKERPEVFARFGCAFYRGAHLWLNAPYNIQQQLLEKQIAPLKADDDTTAKVLAAWKDPARQKLQKTYTAEVLEGYARVACQALKESIEGKNFVMAESSPDLTLQGNSGVAVRFRTTERDRGCLALYSGVTSIEKAVAYCASQDTADPRYPPVTADELDELYVNITLFSNWEKIAFPEDFTPGADSLIMDKQGTLLTPDTTYMDTSRTLLQAPLAAENALDENGFLNRVMKKAAIPDGSVHDSTLIWNKSPSIFFTAKVSDYLTW